MVTTPNEIRLPVSFDVSFEGLADSLEQAGRSIRKAFASQPQPGHESRIDGRRTLGRRVPAVELANAYAEHGGDSQPLMAEPF